MKKIRICVWGLLIFLIACNTLEDRKKAGAVLSKDQLKITIYQATAGSNSITLINKTPEVIMYWDWGTGTAHSASPSDSVYAYIPFKGTYTLRYTAFCAGGTVTDSTTFSIAANDDAFFDKDPAWKGLTGGGAGQTWVWAMDIPGGIIAGNGPENCTSPEWWTMDNSPDNSWIKFDDEITFDLNGAANVVLKGGDGSVRKGFFKVIDPYESEGVKYSGIQLLNGPSFPWPAPADGRYHITRLTPDELSIHEYGQYNIGMFKRKGYVY